MNYQNSLAKIREVLESTSSDYEKIMQIKTVAELTETDKKDSPVLLEEIRKQIEDHSGIPFESIIEKTNRREIVQLRQLAMYKAYKCTKFNFASIGLFFGNKDHATAMHANTTIKNLLETSRSFRKEHESFLIK